MNNSCSDDPKNPASNFLALPLSSPPFNFIQVAPFFRQKPKFLLLPDTSNAVRQIRRSIISNVDKCIQMLHHISSRNGFLDTIISLSSHLQCSFQIPRRNCRKLDMLSNQNFAAILPGDSVAGIVVANGILNFLSIYNTLLVVRLVLTWFPNAPPAVVSPLSTICDPYLNIFRGIIPPLGGTLDLSPILAFLVLNAFTSTASALPAELPPTEVSSADITFQTTASQKKWTRRIDANKSTRSNGYF
ncbi:ylmG homolog protein 2, chloroplastic [Primulina tabacum]|uniref:ylmG homolog protein 2, chloroplastic n=1 Tax=Primulina tabacum TaxID=48773 RepID=UPI003F59F84B